MRKQLNRLFAFILFLPALSFATANVSGKLLNPSPTDSTIWQNAESHLDLHNCGGNYPVVPGASINSHQVYAISTTDGTWSGTLYRNDEISCNASFTTWWTLTYWSNGRQIGPSRDFLCSQASCNFESMTPITVYPPPTPPAQPLTGAQSVSCTFTAATTWTCLNTLNTASVIVDLYDGSGNQLVKGVGSGPTSVVAIVNSVTATFGSPTSGTMYVVNAGNWTPSVTSPNNIIANPSADQSIAGAHALTLGGNLTVLGQILGNNTLPGNNSFTGSNTFSGTTSIYTENGTVHCEKFATPGATFDVIMAACVAAIPSGGPGVADATNLGSTGVLGIDSSALTMAANWSMGRGSTDVKFGIYPITQGTNQVLVPGGTYNVTMEGPVPIGKDAGALTKTATIWNYTGAGSAHKWGDTTTQSMNHRMANMAINIGSAGTSANCMESDWVYHADFDHVGCQMANGSNSQIGIVNNGGAGAPGSQNMLITQPYISGGHIGIECIGPQAPPGCNFNQIIGGEYTGSGQAVAGSIGYYVAAGSQNELDGFVISNVETAIKVDSTAARAVYGNYHAESVSHCVNFATGSNNNRLESDCAVGGSNSPGDVIDTPGFVGQNTYHDSQQNGTVSVATRDWFYGSVVTVGTLYKNQFSNTINITHANDLPTTGGSTPYFTGGDGSPVAGRVIYGGLSGWQWCGASITAGPTITDINCFRDLKRTGFETSRLYTDMGTASVAGDFALSGGWGNTASIASISGSDGDVTITVTSSGTGQGASPTITWTFKDGAWVNNAISNTAPACIATMIAGTGTQTTLQSTTESATAPVFTFAGTPVAASTYRINIRCIGHQN